jgi:Tfp pilus assembly protein PilX
MAIKPAPRPRGAVSLLVLCLISALGVAVGSYFALLMHNQRLAGRHLQNERARELAQCGLEEALWALNQASWNSSGPAGTTAWTTSGPNRSAVLSYPALGPGAAGEVTVTIANYASTGPTWPTIAVQAVLTLPDGSTIARGLEATTAPAPLFGNAIASANAGVVFGAGGTVDSWNSNPDNNPATAAVAYSFTAGNPANYAAVVAGRDTGGGTHGVTLTQATVNGYVATFGKAVGYSVSSVPPGRVRGPATAAGVNVDTTRLSRSAFVPVAPVFDVVLPSTGGANYGGLLGSVLDLVSALLLAPLGIDLYKTNGDLVILGIPLVSPNLVVDRPLKIIVDGNLTIGGLGGRITITPTGSLQLFVTGDCTIGGAGIVNQNVDPATCAIFCTSNLTGDTLQYTSSSDFRGVIYCKNKPIDIRQNATFYGALLSSQQISFSNAATAPVFHYDSALRSTRFPQITTPYVISLLTEP